jgi:hypothetical protein
VAAAGEDLPEVTDPAHRPWVSAPGDLLAPDAPFEQCRELLFGLLDRMAGR